MEGVAHRRRQGKVVDECEFRDPYERRLEVFAPFVPVESKDDGKLEVLVVKPEFKVEEVKAGSDRLKVTLSVGGFASSGSPAAMTAGLRDASGNVVAVSGHVEPRRRVAGGPSPSSWCPRRGSSRAGTTWSCGAGCRWCRRGARPSPSS